MKRSKYSGTRYLGDAEAPEVDAFLADIEAVCRKHGLSIGHEDICGAFEIGKLNEEDLAWLKDASWIVE